MGLEGDFDWLRKTAGDWPMGNRDGDLSTFLEMEGDFLLAFREGDKSMKDGDFNWLIKRKQW